MRHQPVDVPRQLDEARLHTGLLGLPTQVEGIDGDAVPSQTRAGVERHEAEWLGGRGVDHLPDIDFDAVTHQRNLVHQSDVDHAERVFQQFDHLGHLRGTHRHHVLERLLVEDSPDLRAGRGAAADYFGDVRGLKLRIAGIHPLRREAQKEIGSHLQPGFQKHRQHYFVGSARIGGGFQSHQHPGMEIPGDLLARRHDVAHVWIFGLAQRRGDTNVDGVEVLDHRKIGGAAQFAGLHQGRQSRRGNVSHVRIPGVHAPDFLFAYVDPGNGEPCLRELNREGQSDVSQSHDPHTRAPGANLFFQSIGRYGGHRQCCRHVNLFLHTILPGILTNRTTVPESAGAIPVIFQLRR